MPKSLARDSAVPCPLAEGISASRHSREFISPGCGAFEAKATLRSPILKKDFSERSALGRTKSGAIAMAIRAHGVGCGSTRISPQRSISASSRPILKSRPKGSAIPRGNTVRRCDHQCAESTRQPTNHRSMRDNPGWFRLSEGLLLRERVSPPIPLTIIELGYSPESRAWPRGA